MKLVKMNEKRIVLTSLASLNLAIQEARWREFPEFRALALKYKFLKFMNHISLPKIKSYLRLINNKGKCCKWKTCSNRSYLKLPQNC